MEEDGIQKQKKSSIKSFKYIERYHEISGSHELLGIINIAVS